MRFREFAYQGSLVITLVFGLAQYGLNLGASLSCSSSGRGSSNSSRASQASP
jgi:hypothetical protein